MQTRPRWRFKSIRSSAPLTSCEQAQRTRVRHAALKRNDVVIPFRVVWVAPLPTVPQLPPLTTPRATPHPPPPAPHGHTLFRVFHLPPDRGHHGQESLVHTIYPSAPCGSGTAISTRCVRSPCPVMTGVTSITTSSRFRGLGTRGRYPPPPVRPSPTLKVNGTDTSATSPTSRSDQQQTIRPYHGSFCEIERECGPMLRPRSAASPTGSPVRLGP